MSESGTQKLAGELLEVRQLLHGGGFAGWVAPLTIDEQVELAFERYDESGDGILTADELPTRVEDALSGAEDDEVAGISVDELTMFLEGNQVSKLLGLGETSRLRGLFGSADAIDRVEQAIEVVDEDGGDDIDQVEVSEALWEDLAEANANNDTTLSSMELETFVEALDAERLAAFVEEKVVSILERYDEDGNNILDTSEVPERQWNRLSRAVGDTDADEQDAATITKEELNTYVTDQVSASELSRGLFSYGYGYGGRHFGRGWR